MEKIREGENEVALVTLMISLIATSITQIMLIVIVPNGSQLHIGQLTCRAQAKAKARIGESLSPLTISPMSCGDGLDLNVVGAFSTTHFVENSKAF